MENTQKEPAQLSLRGIGNTTEKNRVTLLQEQAAEALGRYTKNLYSILEKNNINMPPAIDLMLGKEGYIEVNSSHPAKAKLEDILNARQVLIEDFKEVEVLHLMVHQLLNRQKRKENTFHVGLTSLGGIAFFTK